MGQCAETQVIEAALLDSDLPPDVRGSLTTLIKHFTCRQTLGEVAREWHRRSVRLPGVLGFHGVGDPAWNILLAMFADGEAGRDISVSSACHASGGSATTALRYIALLEQAGFVVREKDPNDNRRVYLRLTDLARERIVTVLEQHRAIYKAVASGNYI